jgi:multidrug efflux pump subunit AcrB
MVRLLLALALFAGCVKSAPQVAPCEAFVRVLATYPGASTAETEAHVTVPLETQIAGLEGITRVESSTSGSLAAIDVWLKASDHLAAGAAIRQRVRKNSSLPQEVLEPLVDSAPANERLRFVLLEGPELDPGQLANTADALRNQLLSMGGILRVDLLGKPERTIAIELSPEALGATGLTLGQVAAALRAHNADETVLGTTRPGPDPDELKEIVIAERSGVPLRLETLAMISTRFSTRPEVSVGGAPAVLIALQQSGSGPPEDKLRAALSSLPARARATLSNTIETRRCGARLLENQPLAIAEAATVPLDANVEGIVVRGADVLAPTPAELTYADPPQDLRAQLLHFGDAPDRFLQSWAAKVGAVPIHSGRSLEITLSSADRDRLESAALDLEKRTKSRVRLLGPPPPAPEIHIELDRDALSRYGLPIGYAAREIRRARYGEDVTPYRSRDRVVLSPSPSLSPDTDRQRLEKLMLTAPDGTALPLSSVARLSAEASETTLLRINRKPAIRFWAAPLDGASRAATGHWLSREILPKIARDHGVKSTVE